MVRADVANLPVVVATLPPLAHVHCNNCGRFLGKCRIEAGEIYLKCPQCKAWTAVLDEHLQKALTMQDMTARIGDRKAM